MKNNKGWKENEEFRVVYDRGAREWVKIYNPKLEKGKQPVHIYDDHPLPVTRRDFIKAGILDSLVLAGAPSMVNFLMSRSAEAAPLPPIVLYICMSGGPGWVTAESTYVRNNAGDKLSPDGLVARGIFVDVDRPGAVLPENYGYPILSNNVTAAGWLQRDRSIADALLRKGSNLNINGGRTDRYAWQGVSDEIRDGILDRISGSLFFCQTPDDGSAATAEYSASAGMAAIMQGMSLGTYLNSGLSVGLTANMQTAHNNRALRLRVNTPNFLPVSTSNNNATVVDTLRKGFGNPTDLSEKQGVLLAKMQKDLTAKASELSNEGVARKLLSSFAKNEQNYQTASSLILDRNSYFSTHTNSILNQIGGTGNSLGAALGAAMQGFTHPMVCMVLGSDGHDGGGSPLANGSARNALTVGATYSSVLAAFFSACADKGRMGIALLSPNGDMRGADGADELGATQGYRSDDGRLAAAAAWLFNPEGKLLPTRGIFGERNADNARAVETSEQKIGAWLASAALPFLDPERWPSEMQRVFDARALAGIDLSSFSPWPKGKNS